LRISYRKNLSGQQQRVSIKSETDNEETRK